MRRIVAFDIARGLAVILMIIAHSTDAFLSERWKSGEFWEIVHISFGFVAPAFLFLSGLVLSPAIAKRQDAGKKLWERSLEWRMIRLVLLGYWLQIPVMSLQRLVAAEHPDDLARLCDVNILQVIGTAGLLVLVIVRMSGSIRDARPILWVLAATIAIATPYLWSIPIDIGLPLAPWIGPRSTFPFFPNAVYLLAGFVLSRAILSRIERRWRGSILVAVGVVAIVGVRLLDRHVELPDPWNDLWGSSPLHLLFRVGGVLVLIGIAFGLERWKGRIIDGVARVGRMSLPLYVVHLVLIYGSPATMGGRYWFDGAINRMLTPLGLVLATLTVLTISIVAVIVWEILRNRYRESARWTKRIVWTAFWGAFVFGDSSEMKDEPAGIRQATPPPSAHSPAASSAPSWKTAGGMRAGQQSTTRHHENSRYDGSDNHHGDHRHDRLS